jgi:hypothetical protein
MTMTSSNEAMTVHDRAAQAVKFAAFEAAATYVARRSLEIGYRRATGRELPTARDRDVPFRQVLVWATVTAAALSATTVVVDHFVLRREPSSARTP